MKKDNELAFDHSAAITGVSGIVTRMSETEVSMCMDLIGEIASQPRVALAESVDAGVPRNLDAPAMALGWTAEEVGAAWARIMAIADKANKRKRH